MSRRLLLLAPLFLLLASPGMAQTEDDTTAPPDGRQKVYKSVTHIDIDAVDVEATIVKPTGLLAYERVRGSFNPLITLRADFNSEMDGSVDEVK